MGGGSLMFWRRFGINRRTQLALSTTREESRGYTEILQEHLFPKLNKIAGRDWTFQKDNAAIHTLSYKNHWILRKIV